MRAEAGWRRRSIQMIAAVAATGTVAVTAAVLGGSSAMAVTAGPITGFGGKCVDVAGPSTSAGPPVQLDGCHGTGRQSWTVDGSDQTIRALGRCLAVTGAGTVSGTRVQLSPCDGTTAQAWSVSDGEIINTGSGKCLDATNWGSASGTPLQIWTCTGAANQAWTTAGGASPAPTTTPSTAPLPPAWLPPAGTAGGPDASVAPGGNVDLSDWQLQLPTGSPGSPTTISPDQLSADGGFHDAYFSTDSSDGAMHFWDPEAGVTSAHSDYPRSELREMNADGSPANWFSSGTNTLSATLRVTQVPSSVCVGQIHLGSGGSTKPLLQLFYSGRGGIDMAIEQTPAGGSEVRYPVGNVPLGSTWSYVIGLSGDTISLVIDGGQARTWTASPSFDGYGMYFKAGDYDQSSGGSSAQGAAVDFYALSVFHSAG
jgi:hypothetical protein